VRYILSLKPRLDASTEEITEALNLADDWYRLGPGLWVIVTSENARTWSVRLRPFVEEGGSLFICRLRGSDRGGWQSQKFWNWMRRRDEDD
jgi:hypothetical protein